MKCTLMHKQQAVAQNRIKTIVSVVLLESKTADFLCAF